MRLAKIIATLGPASQNPDTILKLLTAGVNVIRLNFSHGRHEILSDVIAMVRNAACELNLPVAILGDLQGPKFRIGELENHKPVILDDGSIIRFAAGDVPGNKTLITTNTRQIIEELNPGDEVLLNDGAILIQVLEKISSAEVSCRVVSGAELSEKKGINVPGLKMSNIAALTEKDKLDALFAIQHDLDYLALSFVRSSEDITYLRRFLEENTPVDQTLPAIVAKIEKPQALEDIDAIIEKSDAIMVARGDLGVELKPEKVPVIQKMLINKANMAEKPVITATQILESMIHSATPTRAEVSDIANAVFDGSDALMLSGETAVGQYPVESVEIMGRIIEEAESHFMEWHHRPEIATFIEEAASEKSLKFHQAIAQAACHAAQKTNVEAIVVLSCSGKMALRVSKRKPQKPIIALTPNKKVLHQLNLLCGIYPIKLDAADTTETTLMAAENAILKNGVLQKNAPIVFCAGQTHLLGITNTIKIYLLGNVSEHHQESPL